MKTKQPSLTIDKNAPPSPEAKPNPEQVEEPYNPFAERKVAKPTSDFGALAHMLKTSLGSGILAMPVAFKHAGLVLGAVGTIVIGIICAHCLQLLVRNSQELCRIFRVPELSYPLTIERAFERGPPRAKKFAVGMGVLVTVQLLSSFILGNCIYVLLISQSIHQVVEYYLSPGINVRAYIAMIWVPLIFMCLLRNLKSLVPFSVVANLFVICSFAIIIYYLFAQVHSTKTVNLVGPFQYWPMFLTTVIFALEGIGTVLSIEHEMEHPEHFISGRCAIAYIAMTIVVTVYGFIGFFGYLQYGEETEGSITLNLPVNEPLAQAVKILIALAIFFTYALQFYVPINLIIDLIRPRVHQKYHILVDLGTRITLVSLTVIISISIPNLTPIISLVGAICFSNLGLLFPALIDTMTRYPSFGRFKWRLIKNVLIEILSIVALTSGTYASFIDIIETYQYMHLISSNLNQLFFTRLIR